jgi:hypothetical protein
MDIRIKLTQLKNGEELTTYVNPFAISSITEEDNVTKVEMATGRIFDSKEKVDEIFKLIDDVKPQPQMLPLDFDIKSAEKLLEGNELNDVEKEELKAFLENNK